MPRLAVNADRVEIPADREEIGQIKVLKIENSRLRRLVADLLLVKLELEESLRGVSRVQPQLDHSQYTTAAASQVAQN